jgi:exodeoxyribonuclease VII small subunit
VTDPGLEQRIARIEQIAVELESDRLELEDALRLFEEGVRHLRAAEALLRNSELRIERLLEEADGSLAVEPLEEPDA